MLNNITPYLGRNNLTPSLWLVRHCMVIGLCVLLVWATANSLWQWSAMLLLGISLVFLFCAEHEMIHFTAFKSRLLNRLFARLIGFALLLPADFFRAFHLDHHKYTQNPQADPQLVGTPPMKGAHLWLYLSGYYYWRAALKHLIDCLFGRVQAPYITAKNRPTIVWEGRLHLLAYFCLGYYGAMLDWHWLLTYWLLPVILGMPFLRLYVLAEHHGCDASDNMLDNSRTIYTNPVIRMLAWNMPYHSAHHAYPGVAFHQLPHIHEEIKHEIKYVSHGYWQFTKSLTKDLRTKGSDHMV